MGQYYLGLDIPATLKSCLYPQQSCEVDKNCSYFTDWELESEGVAACSKPTCDCGI